MRKYLLLSPCPLPAPLFFPLMPASFPSPLFFPSPPPPPAFLFLLFWAKIDSVVRKKLAVMADGPLWATPCYCPTNPVACNLLRSGIPKFCDSFLEMPLPIEIVLEMVTRCSTWLSKPIYFSTWVRYSPHHPDLSSESLELGSGGTVQEMGAWVWLIFLVHDITSPKAPSPWLPRTFLRPCPAGLRQHAPKFPGCLLPPRIPLPRAAEKSI